MKKNVTLEIIRNTSKIFTIIEIKKKKSKKKNIQRDFFRRNLMSN